VIPHPRVVFDTSTLIGAVLRPSSIPDRAFSAALEFGVICTCELALDELARVLGRTKFDRYVGRGERLEFVGLLRKHAFMAPLRSDDAISVRPSCRDAKDNLFLALAAASEADVIVSSDEDLLVLGSWHGIPVVTPSEFLCWYDRRKGAGEE
jgi:putative PIN family toxin of toxin-antitoxin system